MSYNNIGLTTPRGSGTSGYVQRNLSHVQPRDNNFNDRLVNGAGSYTDRITRHRKPDESILEHERKRAMENRCVELQLELEEEGALDEGEIDRRVDELRQKLMREDFKRERGTLKPHETHELAAMKVQENEKFRSAIKVNASYVEGEAFDKELQAERRLKAIEERQRIESEREQRAAKMQEERENRAKLRQEELANRGNDSQRSFNSSKLHDSQRPRPRTPQSERDVERRSRDDSFRNSNGLKDRMKSPPVANDQPSRRPEAVGRVHPDRMPLVGPGDRQQDPRYTSSNRDRGFGKDFRRPVDTYRPTSSRRGPSPVRRSRSASNPSSRSRSRSYSTSPERRNKSPSKSYSSSPRSPSRSRSPPPRHRKRSLSRSRSPPRRQFSLSPASHSRNRRSRSPVPPSSRNRRDRSFEPKRHRHRSKSLSRSRSLESDHHSRSKRSRRPGTRSPPPGYRAYSKRSPSPRIKDKVRSGRHSSPSSRSSSPRSRPASEAEDGSMEMSDGSS